MGMEGVVSASGRFSTQPWPWQPCYSLRFKGQLWGQTHLSAHSGYWGLLKLP